jgi:UDP-glucose 4-epimerase
MRLNDTTVAVTGGAGFLGSHVCNRFVQSGANVHIFDNYHTGDPSLAPNTATIHKYDIRDDTLSKHLQEVNPDVLIHLAALHYIPYCSDNPEETFDVNVLGTRTLLEAAREFGPQKVVFASSAAVYPPRKEPNREESNLSPIDIYGKTKMIGEDYMRMFAYDTGVSTTVARLFNIYGPNETNPHLVPAILEQVDAGKRTVELGNLRPKRDFVYVKDVSRAIKEMVTDTSTDYEVYNVGSGDSKSVREVVGLVSEALGEDIDITQDEERVRETDRPNLEADITRIKQKLDWSPNTEFIQGISKLVNK